MATEYQIEVGLTIYRRGDGREGRKERSKERKEGEVRRTDGESVVKLRAGGEGGKGESSSGGGN